MKFVFVTGGVMSSVGKGIVSASIGKLLQASGIKVYAVKMDPYVNVDAGTMNPYQHGEVFVTDDGGETDLDLGHYERFLGINLSKEANITTGMAYKNVIERERRGDYLGQTVQIIPHVTDEIKSLLRKNAQLSGSDVQIVEIGGTVGDIESLPFLEAVRQLRLEEGYENTAFVHVSLVPSLDVTGELKTKPTQHSVQELRRIGIQPDYIVARAREPVGDTIKSKLSLFSSVPTEAIFCSYDVSSIYEVPLMLEEQGMGKHIIERLRLREASTQALRQNMLPWAAFVSRVKEAKNQATIALVGKYARFHDAYLSITEALVHACAEVSVKPVFKWVDSESVTDASSSQTLADSDGIMVLPGFGSRGTEGKVAAIRYARTRQVPFLGICFGMQMAVVEFARSVLGLDANSTENEPDTPNPVVDLLPEQGSVTNKGGTMRLGGYEVELAEDSLLRGLYGAPVAYERHRHRYEVNPAYVDALTRAGLVISGRSKQGNRVEAIELPGHPFYVATQFHPEFRSRPMRPSPPYMGFVKSIAARIM
ncbi:MAG: CTP synthase [Thermoprotei archaeon]